MRALQLSQNASINDVPADARRLPFADGYFDAIVSIDAWEYFGTDDHLLPAVLRVLRSGGKIGMAWEKTGGVVPFKVLS